VRNASLGRAILLAIYTNVIYFLPLVALAVLISAVLTLSGSIKAQQSVAEMLWVAGVAILIAALCAYQRNKLILSRSALLKFLGLNAFHVVEISNQIIAKKENFEVDITLDRPFWDYRLYPRTVLRKQADGSYKSGTKGSYDPRYMYRASTVVFTNTELASVLETDG